jgi:hypothetical protein
MNKLKEILNNFILDENLVEKTMTGLITYLKPILEPVSVDYSNKILVNQVYGISILLLILSLLVIILLVALIGNIIIFSYSDKLMSIFSNKYIRWYIGFNKKFLFLWLHQ